MKCTVAQLCWFWSTFFKLHQWRFLILHTFAFFFSSPLLAVCYPSPNCQAPTRQDNNKKKPSCFHHRWIQWYRATLGPSSRRGRCPRVHPGPAHSIRIATGIEVAIFAADVRDFDSVQKAVARSGLIDVLVVNQGVFVPQELDKQELNEVKFMIDVNLMGSFNMIKAVLRGMKTRKERSPASIALVPSQAGQVGIYGYTAYKASLAPRGLAEALQQEVIAENIRVSFIFPPDTETPSFVEENKARPQLTSIMQAPLVR